MPTLTVVLQHLLLALLFLLLSLRFMLAVMSHDVLLD